MVDEKDRKDFESGVNDSKKDTISQVVTDLTANHPGTPAYYKGREVKQLDDNKREEKKK